MPRPHRVHRMKLALAQVNPTVGDLDGNLELVIDALDQARAASAELVVFPELVLTGYPPKDLLLKPTLIQRCEEAVHEAARHCTGMTAIIGYPCPSETPRGRTLRNAAAVCRDGQVVCTHFKTLLPTYDVFDEHRYFEPGPKVQITEAAGCRLGISICEDLWNDEQVFARPLYHENPIDLLAAAGAQVQINCAASPFVVGKQRLRERLMIQAATRHNMPLVYCNQVGGNDELVFDGRSCVVDATGRIIAQAKAFEPDLLLVDLPLVDDLSSRDAASQNASRNLSHLTTDPAGKAVVFTAADVADAYHALVLGMRDYCRKCGFDSIVLGLSGGIDSAVTAALCVAAIGAENITGVTMPSRYSSGGSVSDAQDLAQRMGLAFHNITIQPAHEAFEQMLAPVFEGLEPGVAEENIQARCRGVLLMAMSNKFGSLLVTTGNKSELAVGYCTLYGDMAGGLAALSDVPKTLVWDLARWINEAEQSPLRQQYGGPVIPEDSITKPPSAELRHDQKDEDSLPPYQVLDQIIERYVERDQSAQQIVDEAGIDRDLVLRIVQLIDRNEYKRKQAAPGIKITGRAFGFGRRMPIAQRYRNRVAAAANAES